MARRLRLLAASLTANAAPLAWWLVSGRFNSVDRTTLSAPGHTPAPPPASLLEERAALNLRTSPTAHKHSSLDRGGSFSFSPTGGVTSWAMPIGPQPKK